MRVEVQREANDRYDQMGRKDREGTTEPLYRGNEWNRSKQVKEKEQKRRKLSMKDGSEAVFFMDRMPESTLTKKAES